MHRNLIVIASLALVLGSTLSASAAEPSGGLDAGLAAHAATYGLSADEFNRLAERQATQRSLVAEVRAQPDRYGGIYWDWTAENPGFVVRYADPAALGELGGEVSYQAARHSLAELESVRDEIATLALGANPGTSGFVSVGVDERSNTVAVAVAADDSPFRELIGKYGDTVTITNSEPLTPAACNNREDCVNFRGGIKVSGPMICSYGHAGRRNGGLVVVISGHCDWNTGNVWNHNNTQGLNPLIGTSTMNGLHNGLDTDVLRINVTGVWVSNPRNRVYHSDASKSLAIKGTVTNGNVFVGMSVRRVGFRSAAWSEVDGGRMLYVMDVAGWPRFAWGFPTTDTPLQGDSGGTVYYWSGVRYELVGFTSTTDGIFASQGDAKSVLDIDFWCVTDAC